MLFSLGIVVSWLCHHCSKARWQHSMKHFCSREVNWQGNVIPVEMTQLLSALRCELCIYRMSPVSDGSCGNAPLQKQDEYISSQLKPQPHPRRGAVEERSKQNKKKKSRMNIDVPLLQNDACYPDNGTMQGLKQEVWKCKRNTMWKHTQRPC